MTDTRAHALPRDHRIVDDELTSSMSTFTSGDPVVIVALLDQVRVAGHGRPRRGQESRRLTPC